MKGIIYKYVSPSRKVYIGQTIRENKRRSQFNNLNYSYGGKGINNARNKYLPENFTYEILQTLESDSKEDLASLLNDAEKLYIDKFKSNNPKYGYNETVGGQNAANYGMLGKHHTEQTKKILSQISKNPENIKRLRENGMKTAIKVAAYNKKTGEFYKEYNSISEAARDLGADKGNIAKCIDDRFPNIISAKGYTFKKI